MNNKKVAFIQSTGAYGANPENYFTLKEWQQKSGKDLHSIMQDPGFVNATAFDFRFRNRSTINTIGFKPFDMNAAGVTGARAWKELAKLPATVIEAFNSSVVRNMLP
jgi:hypothetical protein